MSDTNDLAQRIEEKLAADEERRRALEEEEHDRRAEHELKVGRFAAVANDLASSVIRPRLEKLVSYFDNAAISSPESGCSHCVCRFESTPRFPASTTLEIAVAHDEAVEKFTITYNLEILPVFVEFEPRDSLTLDIEDPDRGRLAEWIDDKLVGFVDTYLKLEHIEQYQRRNIVTDPVCKARVHKGEAAAEAEFMRRRYFFCSEECRQKFVDDPHYFLGTPKR
jgi:YHS domain-containing protein